MACTRRAEVTGLGFSPLNVRVVTLPKPAIVCDTLPAVPPKTIFVRLQIQSSISISRSSEEPHGDESRKNFQRSRHQGAAGGGAGTAAQDCRARSAGSFSPSGGARVYGGAAAADYDFVRRVHVETRGPDPSCVSRQRISLREIASAGCAGVSDGQRVWKQRAVQPDVFHGWQSRSISTIP